MSKIDLSKYTQGVDPITGLTGKSNSTKSQFLEKTDKIDLSKYVNNNNSNSLLGLTSKEQDYITNFNLDEGYKKFVPEGVNYGFENVDELRSLGQGPWRKMGNGALRLVPSIISKFGEGIGYVGGFTVGGSHAIVDRIMGKSHEKALQNFSDITFNNFMVDFFHSAENYMKEDLLPVYKQKAYLQQDSFWEKVGTADFWAEDFIDGVAFAASAFIPGGIASKLGLIGKAGLGSKVINATSKTGKQMSNFLGKAKLAQNGRITATELASSATTGSDDLMRIAGHIDTATLTAYNTVSEAGFEAKSIRDELLSQGVDQHVANSSAMNVFALNSVALSVSNFWEMNLFFKPSSIARKATQELVATGKVGLEELTTQVGKKTGLRMAKKAAQGVVMEGAWEENIQVAIEKTLTNVALNSPEDVNNYSNWLGDIFTQMGNNFYEQEGQTAMFLGALLGGTMGAFGAISDVKREADEANYLKQWLNQSDLLFKANATSFYEVEEVEEDGKKINKIKLNDEGKPILNKSAVSKLFYQTMYDKTLFDKFIAESVAGNDAAAEMLQEVIFARHMYKALNDPYLDREEALDLIVTKLKLQADKEIEKGAETDIINSILEKNLDKLERYKKLNDSLNDRFDKYYDNAIKNEKLKPLIKNVQYAEGVRQMHIEDAIKRNRERESQLSGIKPVDDKLMADIEAKEEALNKILEDSYEKFELLSDPKYISQMENEISTTDYSSITDEITSLEEQIKEEENADNLKELKNKLDYAKRKLNYLHNEQEPKIYGAENTMQGQSPKRGLADVARSELFRLLDKEGKKQEHLFMSGMSYIQLENLNTIINEYINDKEAGPGQLQEIINWINNPDNVYALDDKLIVRIEALVNDQLSEIENIESQLDDNQEQQLNISKETLNRFDEERDRLLQETPEEAELIEQRHELESISYEMGMPVNEGGMFSHLIQEEAEKIGQLKQEAAELQNKKERLLSLSPAFELLKERVHTDQKRDAFFLQATLEDLKRDIVSEYAPAVDLLIQAYNNDKENFAQAESVQAHIDKIEFLIQVSKDQELDLNVEGLLDQMNDHLEILKEMLKVAKDNQANRYAKQLSISKSYARSIFNAFGINVDFVTNEYSYTDSPILIKLKEALGSDFLDSLLEAAKNETDPNMRFDLIFAEILIEKVKLLTGDIKKELLETVSNSQKTLEESLNLRTDILNLSDLLDQLMLSKFSKEIHAEKTYTKNHPFFKYRIHRNMNILKDDLLNYNSDILYLNENVTKEQIISYIDVLTEYESIRKLNNFLNTKSFGIANVIKQELATFEDLKKEAEGSLIPVPTLQQDIALAELVKFFYGTSKDVRDNIAYLTGIAGTGKSLIVAKWLMTTLGLTSSDVLALSHNEHSSKNIANSVGQSETITIESLTEEHFNNKTLVIVDEAGAMTAKDAKKLENLSEKTNVKIVTMGDPTQIKASKNDAFANYTSISPLSIVYRTDVVPIANAADMFQQQKSKIEDIMFEVDKTLGDLQAKGVQTVRNNTDFEKVVNSKDNGNSVIIVANEAQKAAYQEKFPNVEVETYEKIQGRTLTNVYIAFNITDGNFNNKKFTNSEFNDAMYTSISRATDFVAILDTSAIYESKVNTQIASTKERSEKEKEDNEERYIERKNRQYEIAKDFLDDVPPLNKPKKEEEKPAEEEYGGVPEIDPTEDIEDIDDGTPTGGAPIINLGDGVKKHKLAYPDATMGKTTSEIEFSPLVSPGTDVVYIRAYDSKLDADRIYVMAKLGTSPYWGIVGIVSQEELNNTEIGKELNSSTAEDNYIKPQGKGRYEINNSPEAIVKRGVIESISSLSYEYTPEVKSEGIGIFEDLKNRFIQGFFVNSGLEIPKNLKFSFRIFTNNKSDKEFLDKARRGGKGFSPKLGIPYMVVEYGDNNLPQFVRLNPRKLKKTDAILKPLIEFQSLVNELEKVTGLKLGTKEFIEEVNKFASTYKPNDEKYTIERNSTENFGYDEVIAETFRIFVELTHGYKKIEKSITEKEFNEEYDAENFELEPYAKQKTNKSGEILYRVRDKNKDPYSKYNYEKISIVSKENSKAQKAFNSLAKANSYRNSRNKESFEKNVKFYITKQVKLPKKGQAGKTPHVTAKSLLGGGTMSEYYYAELSKIVQNYFENHNATDQFPFPYINSGNNIQYEQEMIKKGLITAEELNDLKEFHSLSIDSKFLNDLLNFDEQGNHNVDGNYLRVPLTLSNLKTDTENFNNRSKDLNNASQEDLEWTEEKLSSKLEKVHPSSIVVAFDESVAEQPKKEAKPKDPDKDKGIDDAFDAAFGDAFDRRTFNQNLVDNTGSLITIEEARSIAKRLIPNLEEKDLQFIDKFLLARLAQPGEKLLGLLDQGVAYVEANRKGEVYRGVLRHELFHMLFNHFLKPAERESLLKALVNENPEFATLGYVEQEERLAEMFQDYIKQKTKFRYIVNKIFKNILNFLTFWKTNGKTVAEMFEDIEQGVYSKRKKLPSNFERRTMLNIKEKFGDINTYREAKKVINNLVNYFYTKGIPTGGGRFMPIRFDEIIPIIKISLYDQITRLENKLKNESLEENKIIEIQSRVNLLKALVAKSGNKLVFDEIVKDLFPNYKFIKKRNSNKNDVTTEDQKNNESTTDIIDDENTNEESNEIIYEEEPSEFVDASTKLARDHMEDLERVNFETKMSDSVKHFLNTIPKTSKDGKIVEFVNSRYAYFKTLQLLSKYTTADNAVDFANQLEELAQQEKGKYVNEIVKALITLRNDAEANHFKEDTSSRFINEFTYSHNGNIYKPSDFKNKNTGIVDNNTSTFIFGLSEITGKNVEYLKNSFNKEKARNKYVEITSLIASQKEKRFKIIEETNEYGITKFTYVVGKSLTPLQGIKSDIRNNLIALFGQEFNSKQEARKEFDNWYKEFKESDAYKILQKGNQAKVEEAADALKYFFYEIGLNRNIVKDISGVAAREIANDVLFFLERIDNKLGIEKKVNLGKESSEESGLNEKSINLEDGEKESTVFDMVDVLEEDNNILNKLSIVLASNEEAMRATSVKNGEGKKIFLFGNSSQAVDTIHNFVNNGYLGKGSLKNSKVPEHIGEVKNGSLKINDEYKFNPYLNKLNTIHNVVDHDAIKFDQYATLYSGESDLQWYTRNFIAGFMSEITSPLSTANNLRYNQFFYTISNRPNITGVETNILNKDQIKEAIGLQLDYMLNRKEILTDYIKNYDINDNINFTIITKENLIKLRDGKISKQQVISESFDNLINMSNKFAKTLFNKQIKLDKNFNRAYNRLIEEGFIDKETVKSEDHKSFKSKKDGGEYQVNYEQLESLLQIYFMNNYINSNALNHLVVGNFSAFKDGLDIVKRMSGVFSPGQKGNTEVGMGMKKTYNLSIIKDVEHTTDNVIIPFLEKLGLNKEEISELKDMFGKDFESTDAQGFMLPSRYNDILKGFGNAYNPGHIMKPAHYQPVVKRKVIDKKGNSVEISHPLMVKYSSVVLSDDLISKFPKLQKLRDIMERSNVDEAVFASAVKVGKPKSMNTVDEIFNANDEFTFNNESKHTLSNEYFRLQLNPLHEVDSKVSNPTQLIYFLSALENNEVESQRVYQALADIMKANEEKISDKLNNPVQTAYESMKGVQGSERVAEILKITKSLNFPTITDKAIIQIANAVSKLTVQIKLPGSKLVLQSDVGIEIKREDGTTSPLSYKLDEHGRMYAEVIVPSSYRDLISAGDYILPDMLGFRIPSSELHSAVPLRVVGYYDNIDTNVIIAPKELVPLHGSDFDVDSLFVIRREKDKSNNPIGYDKNDKNQWKINYNFKTDNTEEFIKFQKNIILESILEVTTKKENRKRMLSPITMERLKQLPIVKKLKAQDSSIDLSNIADNYKVFKSNFDGLTLTGIYANSMKALAYMVKSGPTTKSEEVEVSSVTFSGTPISLIINNKKYDFNSLSEYEKLSNKPIWQSLDSLLNAATDNVKEQIIPYINATDGTGTPMAVMIALGVPLETVVDFFTQPVMRDFTNRKARNTEIEINNIYAEIQTALNLEINDSLSLNISTLNKLSMSDVDFATMLANPTKYKEELIIQFHVLKQFNKLNALSNDLQKISKIANLLKEIPVFYEEMATLDETLKDIFENIEEFINDETGNTELVMNENFSFTLDNFLKRNVHIKEAIKYFYKTKNKIDSSIFKHGEAVNSFIDSLDDSIKSLNVVAGNENKKKEVLKSEILKYLVTGLPRVQEIIIEGNSNPYVIKKGGKERSYSGAEGWSYNFVTKIQELKSDPNFRNNHFVKFLDISDTRSGRKYIKFTAGSNLQIEDLIELQDAFASLPKDLQEEFANYAIINYGLSFGVSNYTVIISDEIIESIGKEFDTFINKLNEEKLIRLREHFEISYALNNASKLKWFTTQSEKVGGFNKGEDNFAAYDLKFKNEESSNFPKYAKISGNYGEKVYVRISEDTPAAKYVYYQEVGYGNSRSSYEIDRKALVEGYSTIEYFRLSKSVRIKEIADELTINTNIPIDSINVIGYTDSHRINRAYYKVESVEETPTESYKYKINIVKIKNEPPKIGFSEKVLQDILLITKNDNTEDIKNKLKETKIKSKKDFENNLLPLFNQSSIEIYNQIKKLISDDISINFYKLNDRVAGNYNPKTKQIKLNSNFTIDLEHTIMHELVHDVTYTLIESYKDNVTNLNRKQRAAMQNLVKLHQAALAAGKESGINALEYGLKSVSLHEFIAEFMTNPKLQAYLNTITAPETSSTIFDKIIDFIMELIGLKANKGSILHKSFSNVIALVDASGQKPEFTFKEAANILNKEVPLNEEKNLEDNYDEFKEILEVRKKLANEIKLKIEEESKSVIVDEDTDGNQMDTYNNGKYKRVSSGKESFISNFLNRTTKFEDSRNISLAKAESIWGDKFDKDTKLKTDLGELTFEEYVNKYDQILLHSRKRGSIIHKIIQRVFTKEKEQRDILAAEIGELLQETGERFHYYEWVVDNIEVIFKNAGLNITVERNENNEITKVETNEEILSEIAIASDIFGYAGTIDSLVKHEDGTFSIIDWKTGSKFDDEVYNNLLKYGDQVVDVTDNNRQRAKLQVMMYAVMLKAENPEIEFRNLMAIWVPNRYQSTKVDHKRKVEVNVYLDMIRQYLKNKKPELYDQLLSNNKNIFNVSEYNYTKTESYNKDNLTPGQNLDINKQRLKEIINRTAFTPHLAAKSKEEVVALTNSIIEAEKDNSTVLHDSEDISWTERWIGTYGDVNNPYLQTYKKILLEAKHEAEQIFQKKKAEFDRKLLPVLNNYLRRSGKKIISQMSARNLNFIKYYVGDGSGLYDFAYKNRKKDDFTYMDLITPNDQEWIALSNEQKELLTFIQDSFSEYFIGSNNLMEQVAAVTETGKKLTNEDLVNRSRKRPFEYNRTFLPKVPQTEAEIRQKYSLFSKDRWKHIYNKYATMYYENTYNQWSNEHEALPIKYLGNDYIGDNYSMNLENIFDKFVRNMELKKTLDPVHAIGRGLQIYYENKNKEEFKNTIDFLEDHILLDILDRKNITNFFRKNVKVNGNSINVSKVLRSLKNAVAAPIMWLQPINGTRNALFISMLNAKKSIADTVSYKLLGVDENVIDFTISDMNEAWKEWAIMQKDFMLGKGTTNKTWLLTRKFKYLPDNYDWASQPKELLGERRDIRTMTLGAKTMYMFHSIPEEWNATMVMVAQMKRMKHKGKSLWDHYNVEITDNIPEVKWTGGIRGIVKDKDGEIREVIEGVTAREAEKMKRVYQMMHGGYRRDERTAAEAYVLGEIFLQFRKYLPSVLMNAFRSKSDDLSIGYYKFTGEQHNGEDVMEWIAKQHEGRWRVLGKMIGYYLINREKYKNYSFDALPDEVKKQFVDGIFTIMTWMMMYGAYVAIFADTDDDDSWKRLYKITMDNYSQQYNLYDIGKNFTTMPATFTKSYKALEATTDMLVSGILYLGGQEERATTAKGNLRGWTEVKRTIPYVSSVYNLNRFMDHDKTFEFFRTR